MQMHSIYTAVVAAMGGFSGVAPVLAAAVQASSKALAGVPVGDVSSKFGQLAGNAASFAQPSEALGYFTDLVAPATPAHNGASKEREK